MKRISTLLSFFTVMISGSYAQGTDTLVWQDFELDPVDYVTFTFTPGSTNDTMWYSFDLDALGDGSGTGRPDEWFWTAGYATADSSSGVMGSNSWTNNATTPVSNWLMTPVIPIVDNTAMLSWKSASYQTPKYLDGYVVLASTTDNFETSFTDTLFSAAEYVSHNNQTDSSFSAFTFSPPSAFVHGEDGTYIEYTGDSLRFAGELKPFTVSLSSYTSGHLYIAFVHNSHDDNLLSVDEILVTGTDPTAVRDIDAFVSMNVYPNPAIDAINVQYSLTKESPVLIDLYTMQGKLVRTESKGLQTAGEYNSSFTTANLAKGTYNVVIRTAAGKTVKRVVVN